MLVIILSILVIVLHRFRCFRE